MNRALIVVALPVERTAVLAHLTEVSKDCHPNGTQYDLAKFSAWTVLVAEVGAGNSAAAVETERAQQFFRPDIALFVGVAGGIKDVATGDVVIGTKVYGYERGADRERFETRPEIGLPSYPLIQRAAVVARDSAWQGRIRRNQRDERRPGAVLGPIAAGEKVVKSSQGAVATLLRASFSDALAIEMEGAGFHRALYVSNTDGLIVRGISDLLDGKEQADRDGSQEVASAHAAAFAFELLMSLEVQPSPEPEVGDWMQHDDMGPWRRWGELVPRLYPAGPRDREVWSEAGGDVSRLDLSGEGRTQWARALSLLQKGGGGRISSRSLLERMGDDFPNNLELQYIRSKF